MSLCNYFLLFLTLQLVILFYCSHNYYFEQVGGELARREFHFSLINDQETFLSVLSRSLDSKVFVYVPSHYVELQFEVNQLNFLLNATYSQ